jgi:hypothetical protein
MEERGGLSINTHEPLCIVGDLIGAVVIDDGGDDLGRTPPTPVNCDEEKKRSKRIPLLALCVSPQVTLPFPLRSTKRPRNGRSRLEKKKTHPVMMKKGGDDLSSGGIGIKSLFREELPS